MANNFDKCSSSLTDTTNHNLSFDIGTPFYTAPEIINNEVYNEKVDTYSLAIIYIELLCGFQTNHERLNVLLSIKSTGEPPEFLKENFMYEYCLIKKMLNPDAHLRYLVSDVLADSNYAKLKYMFI